MVEAQEILSKIIGNHRTYQEGVGRPRKSCFPCRILVRLDFLGLPMTSQDVPGPLRNAWEGLGRHIFLVEAQEIHIKIIGNHRTSQECVGRFRKSYFPYRILVRLDFLGLPRTSQDFLGPPRKAWEGLGRHIFIVEAYEIHSKIIGNHRTSQECLGRPRKSYVLGRIIVRLDFLGLPRTS